jgi:hypothetical protein
LIFNELYVGRIVWNKVRMVKNPDTGKRISRPNSREEWQSIEVPKLRIVDDQTWNQVQELKGEKVRQASHAKRRPPHLLSGLLRCGCCSSGMSVHDRDQTGKTRIRCSAVRESGSCSNRRIIYLANVEKAVLWGMAEELKDPRLIETYVRSYNAERQRLAATAVKTRRQLEGKRDRLTSERERAIDMAIKGIIGEREATIRIPALKTEILQIELELASLEEEPKIIALHPAALEQYLETVDRLADVLAEHAQGRGRSWNAPQGPASPDS